MRESLLIMRLVEQSILDLDRPLLDFLPRLRFSDEIHGRRLTMRHVLSHTTGLPAAGRYYGPRGMDALQRVVEAEMPAYQFLAAPGELKLYSNTVFCLAGYAAEIVTGQPYAQLVQAWVFDPLDMTQSTFEPSDLPAGQLALSHEEVDGALRPIRRLPANDAGHPSSFAYGPAVDLAQLACMFLNKGASGGRPFLSESLLQDMMHYHGSRYVTGASHPLAHISSGYGLGLMLGNYQGAPVVRHGGMSQSHNCFFEMFPEQRIGFVLLTNASDEGRLMELLAFMYDRLLGLPEPGKRLTQAPALFDDLAERQNWNRYIGDYLNVEWGGLANVSIVDDRLVLSEDGAGMALHCIGPGRYYAQLAENRRVPLAFLGSEQGPARHLVYGGAPYHRYELKRHAPDPGELLAYCGVYRDRFNRNDEEALRLRFEQGQLWIQEGNGKRVACEAVGDMAFCCNLGFFELLKDEVAGNPVLVWGKATRYDYAGA